MCAKLTDDHLQINTALKCWIVVESVDFRLVVVCTYDFHVLLARNHSCDWEFKFWADCEVRLVFRIMRSLLYSESLI